MMPEHLYRFRAVHALLDGFHELENQDIYFSPPEQLNDPLEGLMDVFWRGDVIVWTNLLRHYLLCLLQSTYLSLRDIYAAVCSVFLEHDAPKVFIEGVSSPERMIRREGSRIAT